MVVAKLDLMGFFGSLLLHTLPFKVTSVKDAGFAQQTDSSLKIKPSSTYNIYVSTIKCLCNLNKVSDVQMYRIQYIFYKYTININVHIQL